MNTLLRISEVLFQKYVFYVPILEIGYESHTCFKEEVDEQLVPKSMLEDLDAPIQTEAANYTNAEGNYYLVIQVEIGEPEQYEVWTVNGEVVENFTDSEDQE